MKTCNVCATNIEYLNYKGLKIVVMNMKLYIYNLNGR